MADERPFAKTHFAMERMTDLHFDEAAALTRAALGALPTNDRDTLANVACLLSEFAAGIGLGEVLEYSQGLRRLRVARRLLGIAPLNADDPDLNDLREIVDLHILRHAIGAAQKEGEGDVYAAVAAYVAAAEKRPEADHRSLQEALARTACPIVARWTHDACQSVDRFDFEPARRRFTAAAALADRLRESTRSLSAPSRLWLVCHQQFNMAMVPYVDGLRALMIPTPGVDARALLQRSMELLAEVERAQPNASAELFQAKIERLRPGLPEMVALFHTRLVNVTERLRTAPPV